MNIRYPIYEGVYRILTFHLSCGVPPLPDKMPFKGRSNAIQGGIAKVYDTAVLKVRPFLDTGHGSDGSGFGSVHRYHAQPFHRCKEIAGSFSPYVPFLCESGFRELELSGLQFLRPAE